MAWKCEECGQVNGDWKCDRCGAEAYNPAWRDPVLGFLADAGVPPYLIYRTAPDWLKSIFHKETDIWDSRSPRAFTNWIAGRPPLT